MESTSKVKNEAAVSLGKLGGLKAAANMTKEQRTARAKKAVAARIEKRLIDSSST